MGDFLVCEECDKGDYKIYHEENKTEEYLCVFCNQESEAECLVDGKPACVNCKMNKKSQNKSPAGSIRSDADSSKGRKKSVLLDAKVGKSMADQLKKGVEMHHKRGDSTVAVEFYKAHKFLQKLTTGNFNELVCLYNSKNDGLSSSSFHSKCDDCKHGIIIIISLTLGYEIAAFSWKGIRKGVSQVTDQQMGGALIRSNNFDFVKFNDSFVYNLPEGIRFSGENDLYLNFDDMARSICNFDSRIKGNQLWHTYIDEISVYKLQIVE